MKVETLPFHNRSGKSPKAPVTKNRFRFRTFAEQIDAISFDNIERFGRPSAVTSMAGAHWGKPREGQSWFSLALAEWRELNLTSDFARLVRQVEPWTGSLTQLIFYRKEVITALEETLRTASPLSTAPVAVLTAALVRDLGEELVPFFVGLFEALLMALGQAVEVENIQIILGSTFFFIKTLLPDIGPTTIIDTLLEALQKHLLRQLQDFLVEFAGFILGRSWEEPLLRRVVDSPCTLDIRGAIIASACIPPRRKSASWDMARLELACLLIEDISLFQSFLLVLIGRIGPVEAISLIGTIIEGHSKVFINFLQAAKNIFLSSQGNLLLPAHLQLLNCLTAQKFDDLTVHSWCLLQDVLTLLLATGRIALNELLTRRPILNYILGYEAIDGLRGYFKLILEAPVYTEPLVGSIAIVKKIMASDLWRKRPLAALFIIDRLLDATTSPTITLQMAQILPLEDLKTNISTFSRQDDKAYQIALLSAKLISRLCPRHSVNFEDCLPDEKFLNVLCLTGLAVEKFPVILLQSEQFLGYLPLLRFLHQRSTNGEEKIRLNNVADLFPSLLAGEVERRSLAIKLAKCCFTAENEEFRLISLCCELEATPWTFNCDRDKGLILQQLILELEKVRKQANKEDTMILNVITRYLWGLALMAFHPIQHNLFAVLEVLANHFTAIHRQALLEVLHQLSLFNPSIGKNVFDSKNSMDADAILNDDFNLPNNFAIKQPAPTFNDGAVAVLMSFLRGKPSFTNQIKDQFLLLIVSVLGDQSTDSIKDSWWGRGVQKCLNDVLVALGGMHSASSNSNLQQLLWRFLAFGETATQQAALHSLISLNLIPSTIASQYRERWDRLLGGTLTFSDELTTLSSEQELLQLNTEGPWTAVRQVMIPILYGMLISRRNGGTFQGAILNYIATWDTHSIELFFEFVRPALSCTHVKRWIGSLRLLTAMVACFGRRLNSSIVNFIIAWLVDANSYRTGCPNQQIFSLMVKCLYNLFSTLSPQVDANLTMQQTWPLISKAISRLAKDFMQERSSLLDLLCLWIREDRYHQIISSSSFNDEMWTVLFEAVGTTQAKPSVFRKLLQTFSTSLPALPKCHLPILVASIERRVEACADGKERPLLDLLLTLLLDLGHDILLVSSLSLVKSLITLLTLSKGTRIREEVKVKILQLLLAIPMETIVKSLSMLVLLVENLLGSRALRLCRSRYLVAQLVGRLAREAEPRLTSLAAVLQDLHAPSLDLVDGCDFERQTKAFSQLRQGEALRLFPCDLSRKPFILSLMYFCHDVEDVAGRTHAFSILTLLVTSTARDTEKDAFKKLIGLMLREITRGLRNPDEGVRTDFLNLLITIVKGNNDESSSLFHLKPLCHEVNEQGSIMENLLHLQVHRRTRALKQLASHLTLLDRGIFSRSLVDDILAPLLNHWIFPPKETDRNGQLAGKKSKRNPNVRPSTPPPLLTQRAIEALATAWRHLSNKLVMKRLFRHIKAVEGMEGTGAKVVIKFITTTIGVALNISEWEQGKGDLEGLLNVLYGILHGQRSNHHKGKVFRPPVAVAIGELLAKIASGANTQGISIDGHLCKLVNLMAAQPLVSKLADHRAEGRAMLTQMALRLPSHLAAILAELRASLGRGDNGSANMHILAFTVHQILAAFASDGDLKAVLEDKAVLNHIIYIIGQDAFGERAREKLNTEWTGRWEEIRTSRSGELVRLLMRGVPFSLLLPAVLFPLQKIISTHVLASNDEVRNVETILRAVEEGLQQRPITEDLYVLATLLLSSEWMERQGIRCFEERWLTVGCRLALYLAKSPDRISQLVPQFTPLLLKFVQQPDWNKKDGLKAESNYTRKSSMTMMAIFKALAVSIRDFPLSAMKDDFENLLKILFELVVRQSTSSGLSESSLALTSAAFKLISVLVRETGVAIADTQLKALLEYIKLHLLATTATGGRNGEVAFSLVRAILQRRLLLPELYELMSGPVRNAIIRSFDATMRSQCRSLFISFLCDYPMSQERLEEHLDFFLYNLRSYAVTSGRESAIHLLTMAAERLALEKIEGQLEVWLLTLSAQIVNERTSDSLLEPTLKEAVRQVTMRLNSRQVERIRLMIERWLDDKDGNSSTEIVETAWALLPTLITCLKHPVTELALIAIKSLLGSPSLEWTADKLYTISALLERDAKISREIIEKLMQSKLSDCVLIEAKSQILERFLALGFVDNGDSLKWMEIIGEELIFYCSSMTKGFGTEKENRKVDQKLEVMVKNMLHLTIDAQICTLFVLKLEQITRSSVSNDFLLRAILKYYAAIIISNRRLITEENFTSNVSAMLMVVSRMDFSNHKNLRQSSEETELIGSQVVDLLRHHYGRERIDDLGVNLRQQAKVVERKRRVSEAQLAITNPRAHARRKLAGKMAPSGKTRRDNRK